MVKALVISGPTAVGKSKIALELAREFKTCIISADSVQVYKHLDIGSAKPDKATQREIPHHLIDLVEPDENFDTGNFLKHCKKTVTEFIKNERLILITGGTGLYIRAIVDGLIDLPGKNDAIRRELYEIINNGGGDSLYQRLEQIDPDYAAVIHPHDHRRLVRALEVYQLSGKSLTSLHQHTSPTFPDIDFSQIGLYREKAELINRINARAEQMFADGLIEEVKYLLDRGFSPELNSLNSLGYRQVIQYLQGELNLDEAKEELKKHTRLYAKRQMTWFNKDKRINWLNLSIKSSRETIAEIKNLLNCM